MAAGALFPSEAGGDAPCGCRERRRRRRRRERGTAPLLMLCGAAVVAWASVATASEPEENRVRELSGSNWSLLLQGQWMVEFYAPWCPACQQMESAWEAFARSSKDLELSVGKVDVTQEPGKSLKEESFSLTFRLYVYGRTWNFQVLYLRMEPTCVSGRFFVTTLPTIYHAKDGVFRRYRGSRSLEDLQGYILERKWESVEPVAEWKSPSSILMHGMAGLFHLSGWIRQIHNYLTGTLELPVWGSYAVFILATLLIGLILGLILVLLADCFCPPKSREEGSDLVDPSDDKTEELQETLKPTSKETHTESGLCDREDEEGDEDESQENSSEDSAVEGSQTEDDVEQDESGKVEETSVRQRKNQVEATQL